MTPRLRRLLEEQREFIDGLDQDALSRALSLVNDARTSLLDRLEDSLKRRGEESFTTRILASLTNQAEAAVAELTGRMGEDLRQRAGVWGRAGLEAILTQVELMEGPLGAFRLDLALGLQGASGLSLRGPLQRYGQELVSRLERHMGQVLLQRLPRIEAIDKILTTAGDAINGRRSRAALIYRNELSNVYDLDAWRGQKRLSQNLVERGLEGLMARMDEARDRRSHPFSIAAHGTVAPVGEPWRVLTSAVQEAEIATGRRAGGILWPVIGEAYQGDRYIAHHNDRGTRTAWRSGWGDPQGD